MFWSSQMFPNWVQLTFLLKTTSSLKTGAGRSCPKDKVGCYSKEGLLKDGVFEKLKVSQNLEGGLEVGQK